MNEQMLHLRWAGFVMFMEKWLTLAFVVFVWLHDKGKVFFSVVATIAIFMLVRVIGDYRALEDVMHVPINRRLM